jgi:hypothetical protein
MLFLVELDHVTTGAAFTRETGRAFIEEIILPTIAQAERLTAEKAIVAGGPVVGRIALRFMIEAESPAHADRIVTSLPLWPVAETRVTLLEALSERREHVRHLLEVGTSAGGRS